MAHSKKKQHLASQYNEPLLFFRYINHKVWSKAGHFNKALSKGPKTTTWIWNLHSDAHDFDMQYLYKKTATLAKLAAVITRKVFSSNLAHLSLVFFWISYMHFHVQHTKIL